MKDRHAEAQQNGPAGGRRFNPRDDPIWPLLPSFLYRYFTDDKTEAQKGWESNDTQQLPALEQKGHLQRATSVQGHREPFQHLRRPA